MICPDLIALKSLRCSIYFKASTLQRQRSMLMDLIVRRVFKIGRYSAKTILTTIVSDLPLKDRSSIDLHMKAIQLLEVDSDKIEAFAWKKYAFLGRCVKLFTEVFSDWIAMESTHPDDLDHFESKLLLFVRCCDHRSNKNDNLSVDQPESGYDSSISDRSIDPPPVPTTAIAEAIRIIHEELCAGSPCQDYFEFITLSVDSYIYENEVANSTFSVAEMVDSYSKTIASKISIRGRRLVRQLLSASGESLSALLSSSVEALCAWAARLDHAESMRGRLTVLSQFNIIMHILLSDSALSAMDIECLVRAQKECSSCFVLICFVCTWLADQRPSYFHPTDFAKGAQSITSSMFPELSSSIAAAHAGSLSPDTSLLAAFTDRVDGAADVRSSSFCSSLLTFLLEHNQTGLILRFLHLKRVLAPPQRPADPSATHLSIHSRVFYLTNCIVAELTATSSKPPELQGKTLFKVLDAILATLDDHDTLSHTASLQEIAAASTCSREGWLLSEEHMLQFLASSFLSGGNGSDPSAMAEDWTGNDDGKQFTAVYAVVTLSFVFELLKQGAGACPPLLYAELCLRAASSLIERARRIAGTLQGTDRQRIER